MRSSTFGEHRITVESCDGRQSDMREWLQTRIDAEEKRLARLGNNIVDAMPRYKNDWSVDTTDVDVSVEAGGNTAACSSSSAPTICRASRGVTINRGGTGALRRLAVRSPR